MNELLTVLSHVGRLHLYVLRSTYHAELVRLQGHEIRLHGQGPTPAKALRNLTESALRHYLDLMREKQNEEEG